MNELQRGSVRIAKIRARTIDHPTAAILLEEHLDAVCAQVVDRRSIGVRRDHERMVHPVGAFELCDYGGSQLNEQHADATGVKKGHALVGQGIEIFATDDL